MAKYTKDEAVNIIVAFKERTKQFPLAVDYKKLKLDYKELAEALGVDLEREKNELGVMPYAVINIAVLRELRRRKGERVYIANNSSVLYNYR